MNIVEATRSYEQWLARQTTPIKGDLLLKHEAMREDLFSFFRGTYYRWAQVYPKSSPKLAKDSVVLAVGDLHIENFGTWRDSEARLVWGINDFDECHPLPFTHDLVRLATAACIAKTDALLEISQNNACRAVLEGYRDCLKSGGKPFVLSDTSSPLRTMVRDRLEHPERFWKKLMSHPAVYGTVPREIVQCISATLPSPSVKLKFLHRVAGMGSLGRERYTGVGMWLGGNIAREAKPVFASACRWADGSEVEVPSHYEEILSKSIRCHDPFVMLKGKWLLRRLSPDCFRIELSSLPKKRDEKVLLYCMGWETGNIHLGSRNAAALLKSLDKKPEGWLAKAAKTMRDQVIKDWQKWKRK